MRNLIFIICMLLGFVSFAEQGSSASEDPNLRRNFDGASTFLDPTNHNCKPCQEMLRNRQNFSNDVSGHFAPESLARSQRNQPNTNPGLNRSGPVKTGK